MLFSLSNVSGVFKRKISLPIHNIFSNLFILYSLFSAVCALCCYRVHGVNCIKQGINARGSGSLVIADGNTDQRTLTVPWVFGLPLSASLHYKKIGLGGYTI